MHVGLALGAPAAGGEPPAVRLAFSFPEKVVGATRLRDGIERVMSEYDWTSRSETFSKGHRWLQLLDSVERRLHPSNPNPSPSPSPRPNPSPSPSPQPKPKPKPNRNRSPHQVELGLQQSVGEQYAVRSSMGCGGWASVPWLAVSHPSESTQHGLYLQVRVRVP